MHLDLARLRRLSIEALAALSDEELAARVGVPLSVAPVLRGARDLARGARVRGAVLEPIRSRSTRPRRSRASASSSKAALDATGRPARAQGGRGSLKSVRLALTGRERGPELRAVIAALPRDELLADC